eukprot:5144606-Amphidinium_carterae.1
MSVCTRLLPDLHLHDHRAQGQFGRGRGDPNRGRGGGRGGGTRGVLLTDAGGAYDEDDSSWVDVPDTNSMAETLEYEDEGVDSIDPTDAAEHALQILLAEEGDAENAASVEHALEVLATVREARAKRKGKGKLQKAVDHFPFLHKAEDLAANLQQVLVLGQRVDQQMRQSKASSKENSVQYVEFADNEVIGVVMQSVQAFRELLWKQTPWLLALAELIVDTGAPHCLVGKMWLDQFQKVQGTDAARVSLKVPVQGQMLRVEASVLYDKGAQLPLLLGRDWLESSGCNIDCAARTLQSESCCLSLHENVAGHYALCVDVAVSDRRDKGKASKTTTALISGRQFAQVLMVSMAIVQHIGSYICMASHAPRVLPQSFVLKTGTRQILQGNLEQVSRYADLHVYPHLVHHTLEGAASAHDHPFDDECLVETFVAMQQQGEQKKRFCFMYACYGQRKTGLKQTMRDASISFVQ